MPNRPQLLLDSSSFTIPEKAGTYYNVSCQ
jgi:hypothetical protein